MVADFVSLQQHGVEHVFVSIEIEHVAYINVASLYGGIQRERRSQRYVSTGDVELHLVNKIHKGAGAEISVLRRERLCEGANAFGDVLLDGLHLRSKRCHEVGVWLVVRDRHVLGIGMSQHPFSVFLPKGEGEL